MKYYLTLLIFLISPAASTEILEVKNEAFKNLGITPEGLSCWIQQTGLPQRYNGEYYYHIFNKDIHGLPHHEQNLIKITRLPRYRNGDSRIFAVQTRATAESLQWRTIFFIKHIRNTGEFYEDRRILNEKETRRLQMIAGFFTDDLHDDPRLPRLAPLEETFTINIKDNYRAYFSITHAAAGRSVFDILMQENQKNCGNAFAALGEKLSRYHQFYMNKSTFYNCATRFSNKDATLAFLEREKYYKTLTHGDLHLGNIFYHPGKDHITFIDYETISHALNKGGYSIQLDLEAIFLRPFLYYRWLSKNDAPPADKYMNAFHNFFHYYVFSYPVDEIPHLLVYLHSFLTNHRITRIPNDPIDYQENDLTWAENFELDTITSSILQRLQSYARIDRDMRKQKITKRLIKKFRERKALKKQ